VFAGQRDDGFFGDIGAIFDLVAIAADGANGGGKDFFAGYAVHSIALQVPLSSSTTAATTSSASGRRRAAEGHVAKRQAEVRQAETSGCRSRARQSADQRGADPDAAEGQVERVDADKDKQFEQYYSSPILAQAAQPAVSAVRPVPGDEPQRSRLGAAHRLKQPNLNFTGDTPADELRLNLAIARRRRRQGQPLGVSAATSPGGRTAGGSRTTSSTSPSARSAAP
jgi:hypothetical protein